MRLFATIHLGGGLVARIGVIRKASEILIGTPEGEDASWET
jgi:hypothetical protein